MLPRTAPEFAAHPRSLPIMFLFLPLLCVMLLVTGCRDKKEPPKPKPPVPVVAATVVRKEMPLQVRSIGNVEPYNTVGIKAQINGQLAKVHFREGQDVKQGDVLFTIDPRPFEAALKQAQAVLAKDQAQAKYAEEQARRYESLVKEGIVTREQYEQLRTNAEALQAAIAADRAAIDNARVQLGYCTIRSPISGRTGNVMVQAGNLVKANDNPVLVTINQIAPAFVTFTVPEKQLVEVKKFLGQGQLKVQAEIPNDPGGPEQGIISFLDNAVDPATGTIKLKGTFANRSGRLWPGQFVAVVLTLATRSLPVVPSAAVQTGQQGHYVYVVKDDGMVEMRPLSAGISVAGETAVEKGLLPGEMVVTDGQMRLVPGAKVAATTTPQQQQTVGSK